MAKVKIAALTTLCSLNGTLINLRSLEGGSAVAEVIQDTDTGFIRNKHVSNIRYEDFVFETGLNDEITRIIKGTWNDGKLYSDGSFITANADFKSVYEDQFQRALLTETVIPQCDAASKDAAVFRLRLKPESVQNNPGNGSDVRAKISPKAKTMLKSSFRFQLGQLPCARVTAIDSFSVKIISNADQLGGLRDPKKQLYIDFPNLFLTISSTDLAPWLNYYKSFLVDGKHLPANELSGRLAFLAPDFKTELFAINLQGVGIISLQRNLGPVNEISRFRVGLYCQRMEIA